MDSQPHKNIYNYNESINVVIFIANGIALLILQIGMIFGLYVSPMTLKSPDTTLSDWILLAIWNAGFMCMNLVTPRRYSKSEAGILVIPIKIFSIILWCILMLAWLCFSIYYQSTGIEIVLKIIGIMVSCTLMVASLIVGCRMARNS